MPIVSLYIRNRGGRERFVRSANKLLAWQWAGAMHQPVEDTVIILSVTITTIVLYCQALLPCKGPPRWPTFSSFSPEWL